MSTCSVLIPSCDRYADLWQPCVELHARFWPDCPYPTYLSSNLLSFQHPRITCLPLGIDTGWSAQLQKSLLQVPSEIVLLTLEDFFLRRPVATELIAEGVKMFASPLTQMVRLVPRPAPSQPTGSRWSPLARGEAYRVSTQATLWRKTTLQALLCTEETIWEFEINASRRSQELALGFWGTHENIFPYDHHVVERGKWFRREAQRFSKMNIGVDINKRPVMSLAESALWFLRKTRGECVRRVRSTFR